MTVKSDNRITNEGFTKKKLYLQTFGCQMNERDSEAVSGLLIGQGHEKTQVIF